MRRVSDTVPNYYLSIYWSVTEEIQGRKEGCIYDGELDVGEKEMEVFWGLWIGLKKRSLTLNRLK